MLAVAHELMLCGNMDLHFGSFSSLETNVVALNAIETTEKAPGKSTATFHLIPGQSMTEAFGLLGVEGGLLHRPGARGALDGVSKAPYVLVPWSDMDYIGYYEACVELIKVLEPDLIVLDPVFSPGIDACIAVGREFAVLSPNSFREQLIGKEPILKTIFNYPM